MLVSNSQVLSMSDEEDVSLPRSIYSIEERLFLFETYLQNGKSAEIALERFRSEYQTREPPTEDFVLR